MFNTNLLLNDADWIADFVLDRNPDSLEHTQARGEFLRWVFYNKRSRQLPDEYLPFFAEMYADKFSQLLQTCRTSDGRFDLRSLIALMSPGKADAVIKKLGLSFNAEYLSRSEIIQRGLEGKLAEFLEGRYGLDLMGQQATDIADLVHAAYFRDLSTASDVHKVTRVIADHLTSSNKRVKGGVAKPIEVDLDSLMAFFATYDADGFIENIIFDIESRVVFNKLAVATVPHTNDPITYTCMLQNTLEEVIGNLQVQRAASHYPGAQRILDHLIGRSIKLRDFKINGLRTELNGSVFPRSYQAEGVLFIDEMKKTIIVDEMGTGKTAIAVLGSEYLSQQLKKEGKLSDDLFRTLVVTTNTHKYLIAEKIAAYLSASVPSEDDIAIINGVNRRFQYRDLNKRPYVVINYELLRSKDWKLEDYMAWEVEEQRYHALKEIAVPHLLKKARRKGISGIEYLQNVLKRTLRSHMPEFNTFDEALDAYIKIMDLDDAKSVVKSILGHYDISHLIIDEAQNARTSTTQIAKAVREIARGDMAITCLTGTPFVNGLADLGLYLEILGVYDKLMNDNLVKLEEIERSAGIEPGSSTENLTGLLLKKVEEARKSVHKLKTAIIKGDVETILCGNPRLIRDYLRPHMLRRKSTDVLQLPTLTFNPPLDIIDSQSLDGLISLPIYQRLAHEIVQQHDFRNSSDQLRALQMLLLSPGLYQERFDVSQRNDSEGVKPVLPSLLEVHMIDEKASKYSALENIIRKVTKSSSLKRNVVVFSSMYKQGVTEYLQDRLQKKFSDVQIMRIDGDVVDSETSQIRTQIINKFNSSEQPSVLIATLPTMQEAIELHHKCSNVVFLDLPFTWAAYCQGYSRVWRADQNEPVTVHNLLVSDSLDLGKLELILEKRRLGNMLLEGYPLTSEELKILNINEQTPGLSDLFIKRHFHRMVTDALKIMRDLYGSGKEKVRETLGESNRYSEVYANSYILNLMSLATTESIGRSMIEHQLLDLANPQTLDGRVLDIGSGYGLFSHLTNVQTENLEINPIMIERAKEFSPSANYTQGVMQDVHSLYGDDRFDSVIFSLALHYASDEEKGKMLYDIHRTMRQDGYIFITESCASIDEEGRATLADVMEQTGYHIVSQGIEKAHDKKFFKLVAQKRNPGKEYVQPFSLRTFKDDTEEREDHVDTSKVFDPVDESSEVCALSVSTLYGGGIASLLEGRK